MADLNSRKDLLTSLPFSERRLKSVERQLAVPRTNVSVVATSESTTSSTAVSLATADTVTVVTSAVCLIHIYYEVMASATASNSLTIYVRDHDAANGAGVDNPGITLSTVTPANVCPTSGGGGTFVPYGNYLTFANTPKWNVAADNHTFSLRYSTTGGTATFYDRKLFAWVQPF